ncbi:uncharacterized protein LAESUDRAFT_743869 [Laetiporus sulphureus 93-53]|uniref:Up-regulated during septation protein 1 domain-containing protein n=1 Tax=Laetiporus sulphureus 93-53 TaxID=1314785 RepID=A0A165DTQ4_9APHY|nr:uncharacterized protein LAESUDRAFT_743869 [Laetiporus sulphureus 93-53]KZT05616.1 hypothetical protein LAESUDRAFT_743869 [Laetiporus sulphureus 93-53]
MNGIARFLGGGGTPASLQFSPPSSPPSQSPPQQPVPLARSSKPSWPPSPLQSPTELPANESPKMTTAALFLRKDRQKLPPGPPSSEGTANGSFHSPNSSRQSNGVSLARSQGPSAQAPPPVAGPSAPRPLANRVSGLSRIPVDRSAMDSKRSTAMFTTRDELLVSLLASEAIVDSRGCEILSAEEVEELKKEHQVLSSRLDAMTRKLQLETRIRDAAVSLSKANASYKNVSKQTTEQVEAANRKIESVQADLWRISERASGVQRRLLEHRAAVLSHSVRSLEKKIAPPDGDSTTSGYTSPSRSSQMSPTSSSVTSMTTVSSKGRFEHFFAGHSDAVVPHPLRHPPTIAEVAALEDKLKTATAMLEAAAATQADMARDLSVSRLEKEQVETSLGMDLQAAQDSIVAFERQLKKMDDMAAQLRFLESEKVRWDQDREELEERRRQADTLERRLEVLEEQSGEAAEMEGALAQERQQSGLLLAEKESQLEETRRELAGVKTMWDADREAWEVEKVALQDGAESKAQLTECSDMLRDLMHAHGILLASRDPTLPGLVHSVGKHIEDLHAKIEAHSRAEEEWVNVRMKLETDIRAGLDKRESIFAELETARKATDEARTQVRELEAQLKEQAFAQMAVASLQASQAQVEYTGDAAQIVSILQPLWAILPSPEARANKLGARAFRPASPTTSPVAGRNTTSLSEMDVRSLKTLYDPRGTSAQGSGAFTVEAFAARVQALIADDRALIERLIRFAQAHDLLKKNAERAQKLAQDSNAALETYQKQVKMLEDRNIAMMSKQAALEEEVQQLQEAVDRITAERLEIETRAAEQAETCRQLTDANNSLSARALTLASDAASAGDTVRKQLEAQLTECNASLARAKEEIESLRTSQQTQQMALLEELNSMQTENANLRTQLRKK